MLLQVPLPPLGVLSPPASWSDALRIIDERKPVVVELARQAFADVTSDAWHQIQCLLYHWNTEELERKTAVTDLSRLVHQTLRNAILDVQESVAAPAQLACADNFTPKAALEELQAIAHAHRINRHPLLLRMQREGLRAPELRIFLENYYVNNRVFHLHVAAQSLSSPLAMRTEMYQNLFDELGRGRFEDAHPILFLKNFDALGGPPATITEPLGGALHLLNTKIYVSFLSGDFLMGLGGLGFLELAMPAQMQQLYDGMLRSGLTEPQAIFWKTHISLDADHGKGWIDSMTPSVRTREHALSVLRGGLAVLDARAGFYDSVMDACAQLSTARALSA